MKIGDIDSVSLFRILANRLWIRYDVGGISVGRSYQAVLLEGFMDFFQAENMHGDVKGCFFEETLRREGRLRKPVEVQLALGFTELCVLSDAEFAFVALCELSRWYREEAEREGFLRTEHFCLAACLRRLCFAAFPEVCSEMMSHVEYSLPAYRRDSDDRRMIRYKATKPAWEFERFGTNPWS